MGALHDASASYYGDEILKKIKAADADFKQVFSTTIYRTGDWDWPRPDYVCYDDVLDETYALEFKPPFQSKREYLTGLGQSLSYLQKHAYSGLIVPYTSDDGFRIAEFIRDTLKAPEFVGVATSLYAYDHKKRSVEILRPIETTRSISSTALKGDNAKTFWCWWRDLSHYELFDLLNLSFLYSENSGDIYTQYIYPEFYNMMVSGKTKQWDGTPRKKTASAASMKSEKQNYNIPLVQLDLWSRGEGRLTQAGYELLEIGKMYGPDSKKFLDRLGYLILVDGKHLELINSVNTFQKSSASIPTKSSDYVVELEKYLTDNGSIGKRKPTAVTTGKKISYIRDEPKLWNKLGLVELKSKSSYFFPNEGYHFDWERITDILVNGTSAK